MPNLVIILEDQLDHGSEALTYSNKEEDVIFMAEVEEESTHVPSHKARIVLFLSAMRHFRLWLEERGYMVLYYTLEDSHRTLADALRDAIKKTKPDRVVMVQPGDHRVYLSLKSAVEELGVPLKILPDKHFLEDLEEFKEWSKGQKSLRLEFFYRRMRKRLSLLMEGDKPIGGRWNYDMENRKPLPKGGLKVKRPISFPPDRITLEVIELVEKRFPNHPGSTKNFDLAVSRSQALVALEDFLDNRLAMFGPYQDAMQSKEPFLYHSHLSHLLNLKLLSPMEVVEKAVERFYRFGYPIQSVEGFIRQIVGWREYVRGIYWTYMPEYAERNFFGSNLELPSFYWNAETDMKCLKEVLDQVLNYGYAHHIQRLMVLGLYTLLLGVDPKKVHEWFLAMFVDAVEWVELPNVLGMSQYADGGLMASKPYIASGKYINRMSDYCVGCRYGPEKISGTDACPFNVLYWDFLMSHEEKLKKNSQMSQQLKNLRLFTKEQMAEIRRQAQKFRAE
ncbi:cryptochrome/photolyase family protein [Thermocrinis sp.]